jgi:simple sugar transport system substrate-binding protein
MKLKLLMIIGLVIVLTLTLGLSFSCAKSQQTEEVAEETVPVEETEDAEEAETEDAEETETKEVVAGEVVSSESIFEGIEIWLDTGGPPGCSYGTVIYNGAKAAEEAFGCDIEYLYSDWSPEKMLENFKNAVAASPDGIAVMGHPGDDAFEPFVEEAISKGIIVTCMDTELPNLMQKYSSKGFGYVGTNNYSQGLMLAKELVNNYQLGEGDKAFVWGMKGKATRGLRTVGIIDGLEEENIQVDYLEISQDVDSDPSLGVPIITGYLSSNKDCDLIVTDHGGMTAQLENYITAAGLGPDDIIGAGFSLSSATAEGVRNGYIDLVSEGQPFVQGFQAVLGICMAKKYGFTGLYIDTGGGFVSKDNIDIVGPLAEKGIR